jgi:hypothetical protein
MRVSRNVKLIKQRARLGTYATFAGLGILVAGMIASFQQKWLWVSLAALLLGFFLSQIGSYNLRRWSRSPRPDEVVETELKGFDDRYHLYSWALPAPHVLLSPQGIYTFETRDQTGQIGVTGDKWNTKFSLGKTLLLFGQEGLGNPSRDAQDNAAKVQKLIQTALPETSIQVQPVVVFIDKRAQLLLDSPSVPVLPADDIKRWLRGSGKGDTIKTADYRAIEEALDAKAGDAVVTVDPAEEKQKERRARRARPRTRQ